MLETESSVHIKGFVFFYVKALGCSIVSFVLYTARSVYPLRMSNHPLQCYSDILCYRNFIDINKISTKLSVMVPHVSDLDVICGHHLDFFGFL